MIKAYMDMVNVTRGMVKVTKNMKESCAVERIISLSRRKWGVVCIVKVHLRRRNRAVACIVRMIRLRRRTWVVVCIVKFHLRRHESCALERRIHLSKRKIVVMWRVMGDLRRRKRRVPLIVWTNSKRRRCAVWGQDSFDEKEESCDVESEDTFE
jgi:hypothetical protein